MNGVTNVNDFAQTNDADRDTTRSMQGVPPPPASWPAARTATGRAKHSNDLASTSVGATGTPAVGGLPQPPPASVMGGGFDEEMDISVPGRGATFHVRVAGKALAATNGVAVVLHGGGFTGMSWAPAAATMAKDCCVIAPDLRGHGLTRSSPALPRAGNSSETSSPTASARREASRPPSGVAAVPASEGALTAQAIRNEAPPQSATVAGPTSEGSATAAVGSSGPAASTDTGTAPQTLSPEVQRLPSPTPIDDAAGGTPRRPKPIPLENGGLKPPEATSAAASMDGGDTSGFDGESDPLMSLDALAEDVSSLLVEIFANNRLRLPNHVQEERIDARSGQGEGRVCCHDQVLRSALQQQEQQEQPEQQGNQRQQQGHNNNLSASNESICAPESTNGHLETNSGSAVDNGSCNDIRGNGGAAAASKRESPACTKVLLVGHSLGGSIAVRVAGAAGELRRRCRGMAEIAGLVAVDVVEGTALAALDDMPEVLRKIPKNFSSMDEAILWHVKTGSVRNSRSASVVVPSRLVEEEDGRVTWRTNLRSTAQHWRGWFAGMSAAFLALRVPKLLVVAGMDRLDTDLTAAHMQGKFQLKMVYGCGHSVQEDQPAETAASIINFAFRNSVLRRGSGGAANEGRRREADELQRKLARARAQQASGGKR